MTIIAEALRFYRRVCSESLKGALKSVAGTDCRSSVYTASITIWLMIYQRLSDDHSLTAAVEELRTGGLDSLIDVKSLKARSGKISSNTGGYSKARERIKLEALEAAADLINNAIISTHQKGDYKGRRVFMVDGSTLRISHSDENVSTYPQYENQHGKAHYPLVRISVATDAVTGVALRPVYGPYVGSKAVGELSLLGELLVRLPANAILIADRYYGCARVVFEAKEQGHDVVVRIKESEAKKLVGSITTANGEQEITWKSARSRTGKHYLVEGRVIWYTLSRKGFRPIKLFLFTNLPYPIKDIVELYGLRWNVELDLRQLKSTLDMSMLTAKTPEMIGKELVAGFIAYNLIRHIMYVSAKIIKLKPREISFSKVLKRVRAIHNAVFNSGMNQSTQRALNYLLTDLHSLKLQKQNKKCNSEPRKVWPKGERNTMTTSRQFERNKIAESLKESK